jgi:hypothetical protein
MGPATHHPNCFARSGIWVQKLPHEEAIYENECILAASKVCVELPKVDRGFYIAALALISMPLVPLNYNALSAHARQSANRHELHESGLHWYHFFLQD